MKTKFLKKLFFIPAILLIAGGANPLTAKVYQLYYLGGQSNMDGQGRKEFAKAVLMLQKMK